MIDIRAVTDWLTLGRDGIWYSTETERLDYPSDGNEVYAAIEDTSFWFKHRNNCIVSAVNAYPPAGAIFDIGGGNGSVATALAASGFDVAVVEPGREGALNAKRRGFDTVICASMDIVRFKPGSLPAAGVFDVIEHIRDDVSFLRSIREALQHGGRLYLTVPAYQFLWSAEDVAAGHHRRYSLRSVCEVATRARFDIEFASYIFRMLPVPIALLRALPYRLGLAPSTAKPEQVARDHSLRSGPPAKAAGALWAGEIKRLRRRKPMGFGGSCLVVATSR